MTTDLHALRERGRALLLERFRKRAAVLVANRKPTEPAPAPVVNLNPDLLAVSTREATLLAERTAVTVEHMTPVVNLSPSVDARPTVNVLAPPPDLAPLEALARTLISEALEAWKQGVAEILAAVGRIRPAVTVKPADVLLPERQPLVLRLETDEDGTRRIVQEE